MSKNPMKIGILPERAQKVIMSRVEKSKLPDRFRRALRRG